MPDRPFERNTFIFVTIILLLLCFSACAPTSGELKNSLPLMGKNLVEEIRSISIPPFYGDAHNWRDAAHAIFSSSKASIIASDKISREAKRELSALGREERLEYLGRLGRALQVDAVLNGIILTNDNQHEIILQLISSKDSRILWWQASEFQIKESAPSLSDQRALLSKMIEPLLLHIGKRPKTSPAVKPETKTEDQKPGTKPKDKKPDKGTEPADISPM